MDIFNGRPPAISEDTLQYSIFPLPQVASSEASCAALATQIHNTVASLLPKSFLWHRDAFELKVVHILPYETTQKTQWKLEGTMRVGDSVDDEWCVVWLLRELTTIFDVAVSIFDSDGEFLLIEAAEALPAWVSPSNAENRVWVYKSRLHLIPILYTTSPHVPRHHRSLAGRIEDSDGEGDDPHSDDEYLGPADALHLLRDPLMDTLAPPEVEVRAWERIRGYPNSALQHTHRTLAYIPRDIALALSQDPALIQRAVETFYTRDAIQLRVVHQMVRFPPQTSVIATVRMTRPAYAQLMGQKFHPPRVFGHWGEPEGTTQWRMKSVGMKIACGFEMLFAETKSKSNITTAGSAVQNAEALKDALRRDPEYQKYIKSLSKAGYFDGELEGSQKWRPLETRAAQAWVDMRREDNASRRSFASAVIDAIAEATATASSGSISLDFSRGEDSDAWLNIDEDMLNGLLARGSGSSSQAKPVPSRKSNTDALSPETGVAEGGGSEEAVTAEQADRLHRLAGKVEAFVEGEGDLQGARFDDDLLSDEAFSDDEDDDAASDSSQSDDSDKRAEKRTEAQARLVPPLPESEYGVMPASYSNSQRVSAPTIVNETVPTPSADTPNESKPIRRPILMRDKFDGVDSDDETDSENELELIGGDDEDEDQPTVVGDVEVDMEAEEQEFLQFSREALGISQAQWGGILSDRAKRGAFIPISAGKSHLSEAHPSETSIPPSHFDAVSAPSGPPRNTHLDSFEAVMQAMDAELQGKRNAKSTATGSFSPKPKDKGKGKATFVPTDPVIPERGEDDVDDNLEETMDAELRAALETGSDSEEDDKPVPSIDYNLIKNFLESFKSQGGLSGPVSNLAGRLEGGWGLPRDQL